METSTNDFQVGPTSFAIEMWTLRETKPDDQPGFAFDIHWWNPKRIHQPYFFVGIWRWRLQIGWMQ